MDEQDAQSLRTEAALRLSYDWQVGKVLVRPYVRAGWQHEFLDESHTISARLASGAGSVFDVEGSETARDSVVGGAGTQVLFSETISAWIGYSAEANADVEIHSVNASVGFRF